MKEKKTILVAPLCWGLGHATRCIPLIRALKALSFNVLIGSDGDALRLLQQEFPNDQTIILPSYNISYPENGKLLKWKLMRQLPHLQKTMKTENRLVKRLVSEGRIQGIISDNRFGIRNKEVPSVFITHQLNVLSGSTSSFSSKLHQQIISKFDECWVPDHLGTPNFSGVLGHLKKAPFPVYYMGLLSRMRKKNLIASYDYLVLISGPEPQRSIFEKLTLETFKDSKKKVFLLRGVMSKVNNTVHRGNMTIQDYLTSHALEKIINESKVVISRSGYTTIMDLAVLEKKAFFIPTPGQYEQEYLAKHLMALSIAPYCSQENFTLKKLDKLMQYDGLKNNGEINNFNALFALFQGK